MKILHFFYGHSRYLGGPARLYYLLKNDGNEHFFYIPHWEVTGKDFHAGLDAENIHLRPITIPLRGGENIPLFGMYFRMGINTLSLLPQLRNEPFDLVHGHSPLHFLLPSAVYAWRKNLPLVAEMHSLSYDDRAQVTRKWYPAGMDSWIRKAAMVWEKWILKRSDSIICQTPRQIRRLKTFYPLENKDFFLVPNGVDAEIFNPGRVKGAGASLRTGKSWEGKIVFLYAGFLNRINGIDFLLNSWLELSPDILRKVKLVIVGNGPLENLVRMFCSQYPDKMEFLGQIPHVQMPVLYSAVDIVVLPRPPHEAARSYIPIKLMEALAMEKIVLGSDVDGLKEVIEDGITGFLYRKGDAQDFIRRISRITRGMPSLTAVGKEGRNKMIRLFKWDCSRNALARVYAAAKKRKNIPQ